MNVKQMQMREMMRCDEGMDGCIRHSKEKKRKNANANAKGAL